jgi:predicted SAM-dependent methyltransferase
MRRLNIGGLRAAAGWEVLNIAPAPYVDHVGDARDLSRFPDGSFRTLYASHVLEHCDYQREIVTTLAEWRRVLVPGGALYVSVPDLNILAQLFIAKELTLEERFHVMRMMFGGHMDAHDYHVVGLDADLLGNYLRATGFDNIRRVDELGFFDDTSALRFRGVRISLNMIAEKASAPAAA